MQRGIVRTFVSFMDNVGISITAKHRSKYISRRYAVTFCLCLGMCSMTMYPITKRHDKQEIILGIGFICSDVTMAISYFAFLRTISQNRALLTSIDNNVYNYADEPKIVPNYAWIEKEENMEQFFKILFIYECCSMLLTLSMPPLNYLITGTVKIAMFPGWMPTDNPIVKYVAQLSVIFTAGVVIYLKWCFPLFINFEFERQCKRLVTALVTVERRSQTEALKSVNKNLATNSVDDGKSNDTTNKSDTDNWVTSEKGVDSFYYGGNPEAVRRYSRIMNDKLIQCIQHHQYLIKTHNSFKAWFVITFSTQLLMYSITIGMSLYSLLQPTTMEQRMSILTLFFIIALESFLWCYVGEQLSEMNDLIKDAIFYEINWSQQPSNIKRLITIFHMLVAQKPFTLYGFSIFEATYKTFAKKCRTSYTYFNLLRSSI